VPAGEVLPFGDRLMAAPSPPNGTLKVKSSEGASSPKARRGPKPAAPSRARSATPPAQACAGSRRGRPRSPQEHHREPGRDHRAHAEISVSVVPQAADGGGDLLARRVTSWILRHFRLPRSAAGRRNHGGSTPIARGTKRCRSGTHRRPGLKRCDVGAGIRLVRQGAGEPEVGE
jgi:hypothetical protein